MNQDKTNQKGRSMLEILLVLAIMALLMMVGIMAFPKLLKKHNQNELLEQITFLANDIRDRYALQNDYQNLDNQTAIKYGIVSTKMQNGDNISILHSQRGNIVISIPSLADPSIADNKAFELNLDNIDKDSCIYIMNNTYSTDSAQIYRIGIDSGLSMEYFQGKDDMALSIEQLYDKCNCTNYECIISFTFL